MSRAFLFSALLLAALSLPANAQYPLPSCPGAWIPYGGGQACRCPDGSLANMIDNAIVCPAQQQQDLRRDDEFSNYWYACNAGDIAACDRALTYGAISQQDREWLTQKRADATEHERQQQQQLQQERAEQEAREQATREKQDQLDRDEALRVQDTVERQRLDDNITWCEQGDRFACSRALTSSDISDIQRHHLQDLLSHLSEPAATPAAPVVPAPIPATRPITTPSETTAAVPAPTPLVDFLLMPRQLSLFLVAIALIGATFSPPLYPAHIARLPAALLPRMHSALVYARPIVQNILRIILLALNRVRLALARLIPPTVHKAAFSGLTPFPRTSSEPVAPSTQPKEATPSEPAATPPPTELAPIVRDTPAALDAMEVAHSYMEEVRDAGAPALDDAASRKSQLNTLALASKRLEAAQRLDPDAILDLRTKDDVGYCVTINELKAEALVLEGLTHQLFDTRRAIPALKRATVLNPQSSRAFFLLGLTHSANMNKAEALVALRQAVALEPKNISYRKELDRAENLTAAEIVGYKATRAGERIYDAGITTANVGIRAWNIFATVWNILTFPMRVAFKIMRAFGIVP